MATRTSEVDETVPADNVQVDKALIRANFQAAKDEIDELLRRTGYAWVTVTRGLSRTMI